MIDYVDKSSNIEPDDEINSPLDPSSSSYNEDIIDDNRQKSKILDLASQSIDDLFIYPAVIERGHR